MAKQEFAMLAHHISESTDYSGWYASRKLDGWGCIWDGGITTGMKASDVPWNYQGADKSDRIATGLWTIGRADKYGIKPKVISAPQKFIEELPFGVPLHGELWKNDDRDFVQSVCSKLDPVQSEWNQIKFMVYNLKQYPYWVGHGLLELPNLNSLVRQAAAGEPTDWKSRMEYVWNTFRETLLIRGPENMHWSVLGQAKIESPKHLNKLWEVAKDNKWEGLVLVNPFSKYQTERSYSLLKKKTEYDIECLCTGWTEGKGRHNGRVGALECSLTWDEKVLTIKGGSDKLIGKAVKFKVAGGLSDEERDYDNVEAKYVDKWIKIRFNGLAANGCPPSATIECLA